MSSAASPKASSKKVKSSAMQVNTDLATMDKSEASKLLFGQVQWEELLRSGVFLQHKDVSFFSPHLFPFLFLLWGHSYSCLEADCTLISLPTYSLTSALLLMCFLLLLFIAPIVGTCSRQLKCRVRQSY